MCLAMNPDKLAPGERAASTSNRNFEGRQGRGGRTHLVSPAVAAATAVAGHFATPRATLDPDRDHPSCMKAVHVISGTGLPLDRSDVDTDQIIPAEWLKRVERTGFEKGLFATWRDDRNFVLNDERYAGATIIVAGPAFGTGSSREHAVWAIQQYGFEAVIAPGFADIFRNNCTKNGLVPGRRAREAVVERLWDGHRGRPGDEIVVDVERLHVEVAGDRARRAVPARRRHPASASSRASTTSASRSRHAGRHRRLRGHPPRLADRLATPRSRQGHFPFNGERKVARPRSTAPQIYARR